MSEDQPLQFCYLIINNQVQFIINIILECLSVILLGDAIRKFIKMRGMHSKDVTFIYCMLLLWWITYISHGVFNFVQYVLHATLGDKTMSELSGYNFIVNWANAFVIQWILLYVPYHWSKQIKYLFSQIENNMERSSQITANEYKYDGPQILIFLILKNYMYIRLIFLSSCIVFLLINSMPVIIVMLIFLLIDCVFINISLFLGMHSLKRNKKLIQQLDNEQITKMFNQYLMILIANNFRMAFDAYLVYNSTKSQQFYITQCNISPSIRKDQIILNTLMCLLTHYLPIFMILRIYHLEDRPEQMCKSLLITSIENNQHDLLKNEQNS